MNVKMTMRKNEEKTKKLKRSGGRGIRGRRDEKVLEMGSCEN